MKKYIDMLKAWWVQAALWIKYPEVRQLKKGESVYLLIKCNWDLFQGDRAFVDNEIDLHVKANAEKWGLNCSYTTRQNQIDDDFTKNLLTIKAKIKWADYRKNGKQD